MSATTSTTNYGSWTQYGWRVGPDNATLSRRSANLLEYGFGMPYAPLFTYKITPATRVFGNICAAQGVTTNNVFLNMITTSVDNVTIPYYGAPFVPHGDLPTDVPTQKDGSLAAAIQLEYPSTIDVILGAPLTVNPSSYTVTVFGYDWYMQPMQENIIVANPAAPGNTTSRSTGVKAFYGITGVYSAIAVPAGQVQVTTSTIFGLPYAMQSKGALVQYAKSDAVPPALTAIDANFLPGSIVAATSTTSDVRGIFAATATPNGLLSFYVTYFVEGASAWQAMMNGIAAGNNPSKKAWTVNNEPNPGTDTLFGVPQFYTGGYSNV